MKDGLGKRDGDLERLGFTDLERRRSVAVGCGLRRCGMLKGEKRRSDEGFQRLAWMVTWHGEVERCGHGVWAALLRNVEGGKETVRRRFPKACRGGHVVWRRGAVDKWSVVAMARVVWTALL